MGERTFAMLKPEAVARGLVGKVLTRIEAKGFKIAAMKVQRLTRPQAERLYEVHRGKPFFEELINHIISGPVVVMVIEGVDAIRSLRRLTGSTNPADAEVGTIRGDYGLTVTKNIIHAADGVENAQREIGIFFTAGDMVSY